MPRIQRGIMVDYDIWEEARNLGITPTMVIDEALKNAIEKEKSRLVNQ